jgi:hypothetical protein
MFGLIEFMELASVFIGISAIIALALAIAALIVSLVYTAIWLGATVVYLLGGNNES